MPSTIFSAKNRNFRKTLIILPWLLVLFVIYLIYNSLVSSSINISSPPLYSALDKYTSNEIVEPQSCHETQVQSIAEFYQIGSHLGLDKLQHHYENLYGIHLGPIRHKPLNVLEIGLGCTMPYGPGKSLDLWRQFLTHPHTRISFVEFDAKCAERFGPPLVTHMFVGDQADFELLTRVGKEGGPYDVIVDDGGHKRSHQVFNIPNKEREREF